MKLACAFISLVAVQVIITILWFSGNILAATFMFCGFGFGYVFGYVHGERAGEVNPIDPTKDQ